MLASHFMNVFREKNRKPTKGFTPGAMSLLVRYSWPGNVRELMNSVERAVVLSREEYLDGGDFAAVQTVIHENDNSPERGSVMADIPLETLEKEAVLKTLESAGGNKSETARRLGITRKTLHKKLQKYVISD